MKGRKQRREEIVAEYLRGEQSYRDMEARYGIGVGTLHRWVKAAGERAEEAEKKRALKGTHDAAEAERPEEENLAAEVKRLRVELHKAELHNQLLNAMIDIAEEQMGVSIRKKSGARR